MIGKILGAAVIFFIAAWPLQAQVYQWVDENGVRHYSNSLPPEDATDLRELEELKSGPAVEQAGEGQQEGSAKGVGGGSTEEADEAAAAEEIEETGEAPAAEELGETSEAESIEKREEASAEETEESIDIEEEDRPESPASGQAEEGELIEQ
jgi:hypothetical protein